MRRARLALTRLHQHDLTPANIFNYARPRSSEMRSYSFETFNMCLNDESQARLGSTSGLAQPRPTARRDWREPKRRLTAWRRRAGFDKVALPAARSEAAALL